MNVEIVKLDKELPTPKYAKFGDAGMDVYSRVEGVLQPGEQKIFGSGLKVAVPYGFELQVRPRSGLAAKHGVSVLNTPGTVDHGYRGELGVILMNHSKEPFEVKKGERIAQIVFESGKSNEFITELRLTHEKIQEQRNLMTGEEAAFFDAQLNSLSTKFVRNRDGTPEHEAYARRVLDEVNKRRTYEAVAFVVADEL